MELDVTTCYRAMASRDRRFEGRFFVGVTTTGVYCRPGCPAPLPKLKNVQFYLCAAAAEEAGFRPCLRCRPETLPGTPAWLGTSATVSRALRLLLSPEEDELSLEDLAARVGVGDRHLRRLFITHVGAPPHAIVATRRAHFAKKLIEETDLPMTRIAFASGYPNVRRFNDAIRRSFQNSPSRLRENRPKPSPAAGDALVLKLPFKPPFDWDGISDFFAHRAVPGVETASRELYRRTIRIGDAAGIIEVRPRLAAHHLELRLSGGATPDLPAIVERVNRIFDLGVDPVDVLEHLGRDPVLARTTSIARGPRVPGAWDPFEMAIRGMIGQQVSVKGAVTLTRRLVERFGKLLPAPSEGLTHLFPGAEVLARHDVSSIGMPKSRAASIRELARAVVDGRVTFDRYQPLEKAVAQLKAVKGIGDWTAHYIAMRGLAQTDAFPASDLGLLKTAERWGVKATPKNLETIAENWRPWRAYAVIALWTSLAGTQEESRNVGHDSSRTNRNARGARGVPASGRNARRDGVRKTGSPPARAARKAVRKD